MRAVDVPCFIRADRKMPPGPGNNFLPFEKPINEVARKIREFEDLAKTNEMDFSEEIKQLQKKKDELVQEIYSNLTAWERVLVARHPGRPQTADYVEMICEDFLPLAGDRKFGDDKAIVTGLATIGGRRVMLVGHAKGRDLKESIAANWGSPHPEGYRKALDKMRLAEKFHLPTVALIDTKGAYPGVEAEERGQSMAIARNLLEMSRLRAPIICVVIGEGGSGGALGIGVGDRLLMLEYSYYSVISPEGCAAILWKDAARAPEAAEALKMTPVHLKKLGVIDEILPEPLGGAHSDREKMVETLKDRLVGLIDELSAIPIDDLLQKRYDRLRRIGEYREGTAPAAEGE